MRSRVVPRGTLIESIPPREFGSAPGQARAIASPSMPASAERSKHFLRHPPAIKVPRTTRTMESCFEHQPSTEFQGRLSCELRPLRPAHGRKPDINQAFGELVKNSIISITCYGGA